METFEVALVATKTVIVECRALAHSVLEQREVGADTEDLALQLKEACVKWDEYSATAVRLAPDLNSFRTARKLAPRDGQAHTLVPAYLDQRQFA